MIVWLASYPKSGNTWIRSLIANYLSNNEGNPLENIYKIKSFPKPFYFKNLVKEDLIKKDPIQLFKYFIPAQKILNKDNKFHILKTHNVWGSIRGHEFSNKQNSLGAIYVVRDPRSIAVSQAFHQNISFEESVNLLLNENRITPDLKIYYEARSSWGNNVISWFNSPLSKLKIRYEDLTEDPERHLREILKFLNFFLEKKIPIIDNKIKETIKICSFKNLSINERKYGFKERMGDAYFFRKGIKDDWKTNLSLELIKKIEIKYKKEMTKLNYL